MSNKIYGTLLLDEKDQYVYTDNSLPRRSTWDKHLLSSLCKNEIVSKKGYDMLPPSIQKTVSIGHGEPSMPITVEEVSAITDILIIVRVKSYDRVGKVFRLDNFEMILKEYQIEIWKRK